MKIRIGGVPEHFNLPIHLAIEAGEFAQAGIEIEWITYKGGTGQMTKALRENEADLCIVLTEGIVADIVKGNPSTIISEYVTTPLIWGIHTAAHNTLAKHEAIFDKKYAISRFGSGSHLMAMVDAQTNGKTIEPHQFMVIKNLEGALSSLAELESDVFYWEKFTTKPYVDNGLLNRVGEYETPWSCFVIAARNEILMTAPDTIQTVLEIINNACARFMANEAMIAEVSHRYKLDLADAKVWFSNTEWATDNHVESAMIEQVLYHLRLANIIEKTEIPLLTWEKESEDSLNGHAEKYSG